MTELQLPPPHRLRELADWFDIYDNKRGYTGEREVQNDLRKWADGLEKMSED